MKQICSFFQALSVNQMHWVWAPLIPLIRTVYHGTDEVFDKPFINQFPIYSISDTNLGCYNILGDDPWPEPQCYTHAKNGDIYLWACQYPYCGKLAYLHFMFITTRINPVKLLEIKSIKLIQFIFQLVAA